MKTETCQSGPRDVLDRLGIAAEPAAIAIGLPESVPA